MTDSQHVSDEIDLDLKWKTRGEAIHVDLIGGNSFRFQENLLPFFFRELNDFILDRWTVARPDALDRARVHWGFVQVFADQFGSRISREGDETG